MNKRSERPRGIAVLLVAVLILSGLTGCVGATNTRTTIYPDGRQVVEEYSDDAVYYDRIASAKTPVNCAGVTFEQCGLLLAIGGLVDVAKGYPARGMNGFELAAKVSGDVVSAVPYGAIGIVAIRGIKSAGDVIQGEGAVYSAPSTVGQGNTATETILSPPTTTTTITDMVQ